VAGHTAAPPEVRKAIGDGAGHTAALPELQRQMGEVARATTTLPAMDQRMATIEDAMPVLVEVQQHLADLPSTMESLQSRIGGLSEILERLLGSLDQLDDNVSSLRESTQPIGRMADKLLSGRRRRERRRPPVGGPRKLRFAESPRLKAYLMVS
jgi:hypothetical protein